MINKIKWLAVSFMMIGALLNAFNMFPYNIMVLSLGVMGLATIAIIQKDKQYIALNLFFLCVYLFGIARHYV